MKANNWLYKHIYIPLVDKRDRNHSKNGFTLFGHLWQFLIEIYALLFFRPSKIKDENKGIT